MLAIICLGVSSCSVFSEPNIQKRIVVIEEMGARNPPNPLNFKRIWTEASESTVAQITKICYSKGISLGEFDNLLKKGAKIINKSDFNYRELLPNKTYVNNDILDCNGSEYIVEGKKKILEKY